MSRTPLLTIDPLEPELERVEQAATCLLAGQIVVIPTDTVYGLAQIVSPYLGPEELMSLKQRPEGKAIPLLIHGIDDLGRYGKQIPDYADRLACEHWPGALTLVVRASDAVPRRYVGRDGSIALRMPDHATTLALLTAVDVPLVCSSANLSGKPAALDPDDLDPLLVEGAALIIDGGTLAESTASTVVSCLQAEPEVLRAGPVPM